MSIAVLTNMLAVNPSVVPAKPKPLTTEAGNNLAAYTSDTPQTTESTPVAQQVLEKQSRDFKNTLYEKAIQGNTQETPDDTKTTDKTANSLPNSEQNTDNALTTETKTAEEQGIDKVILHQTQNLVELLAGQAVTEPSVSSEVASSGSDPQAEVQNSGQSAVAGVMATMVKNLVSGIGKEAAPVKNNIGRQIRTQANSLKDLVSPQDGAESKTTTSVENEPATQAAGLSAEKSNINGVNNELNVTTAVLGGSELSQDAASGKGLTTKTTIVQSNELNINADGKEPTGQTVVSGASHVSTNTEADKDLAAGTNIIDGKELGTNADNGKQTTATLIIEGKESTTQTAITEDVPKQEIGSADLLDFANSLLNKDLQATQTGPSIAQQTPAAVEQQNSGSGKPENTGINNAMEHSPILSQVLAQTGANNENQLVNTLFKGVNSAHIKQSAAQNGTVDSEGQLETVNFEQALLAADEGTVTKIVSDVSGPEAPEQAEVDIDITKSITEQVQVSIGNSVRQGNTEITVKLHPGQLGKVLIKFEQQGDQIIGLLEVDKPQTRIEIQQALPEIIQNLQDSGMQIKRLEVVLSDTGEQQTYKEPSLAGEQQEWSGRGDFAGENNNQDNKSFYEWLTDYDGYDSPTRPQEIYVSGSSINMLV